MSLSRDRGLIVFECDDCGELEETGERDFEAARQAIVAEGWVTRRAGNTYTHHCRGCSR